jgi:hypothetical protein
LFLSLGFFREREREREEEEEERKVKLWEREGLCEFWLI